MGKKLIVRYEGGVYGLASSTLEKIADQLRGGYICGEVGGAKWWIEDEKKETTAVAYVCEDCGQELTQNSPQVRLEDGSVYCLKCTVKKHKKRR